MSAFNWYPKLGKLTWENAIQNTGLRSHAINIPHATVDHLPSQMEVQAKDHRHLLKEALVDFVCLRLNSLHVLWSFRFSTSLLFPFLQMCYHVHAGSWRRSVVRLAEHLQSEFDQPSDVPSASKEGLSWSHSTTFPIFFCLTSSRWRLYNISITKLKGELDSTLQSIIVL